MDHKLKVVTCNMHGFRQGVRCLKELRLVADVIFPQEHWLTSDKLQLGNDLIIFSSSAMDSRLSNGVLRGKPFGNVAVALNRELAVRSKLVCVALSASSLSMCCSVMYSYPGVPLL
jgi:hypothetical protein